MRLTWEKGRVSITGGEGGEGGEEGGGQVQSGAWGGQLEVV